MFRYILLNMVFIGLVVFLLFKIGQKTQKSQTLFVMSMMVLLTIIFDNLMIHLNLFDYNPKHILGVYILKAPLEDLFYPIVASLIVPAIWGSKDAK